MAQQVRVVDELSGENGQRQRGRQGGAGKQGIPGAIGPS